MTRRRLTILSRTKNFDYYKILMNFSPGPNVHWSDLSFERAGIVAAKRQRSDCFIRCNRTTRTAYGILGGIARFLGLGSSGKALIVPRITILI